MLNYCCGGSSETPLERITRYKKEYDKNNADQSYFYAKPGEPLNIVRDSSFNVIFEKKILPEIEAGALCFHIKHFNGSLNIADYETIPHAERITNIDFLGGNR